MNDGTMFDTLLLNFDCTMDFFENLSKESVQI